MFTLRNKIRPRLKRLKKKKLAPILPVGCRPALSLRKTEEKLNTIKFD